MTIEHLWSTPVMQEHRTLPEKMRLDLIDALVIREKARDEVATWSQGFDEFMKSKQAYAITPYNLFSEADLALLPEQAESILAFEKFACIMYRKYLKEALNIEQADTLGLHGRCFGNVQEPGARTFPHYHQAMDHVMVHYLSVGEAGQHQPKTRRHGNNALLMSDPRPAISYPYWEKVKSITPYKGLTVIHPAYVWHETNVYEGVGKRAAIVVNFQVITHNYIELQRDLRF